MYLPIGVIVNSLSVLLGGLVGVLLGQFIPERMRKALPLTFGLASMAMGINYIVKLSTLPAVVLSLILGSIIGEAVQLEKGIEYCATLVKKPISRLFHDTGGIQDPKDLWKNSWESSFCFVPAGPVFLGHLMKE